MSLIYADSFDHYVTGDFAKKGWANSGCSINLTAGRRGGAALYAGNGCSATRTVPATSTLTVGAAIYATIGTTSQRALFWFIDAGTTQVLLRLNFDYTLSVVRGTSGAGTVLATSTKSLPPSTYAYIEFKATIHNTAGAYEVRVNGETWLTATNVNTRSSANNTANQVGIGCDNSNGHTAYFDDFYIADSFLGDIRVDALLPVADGNYQGFTNTVAGRAARYWRIYVLAVQSGLQVAAYEIQMRSTIGGANQCTGGTASADTISNAAFAAAKAFDGTTSTMWESSTGALPHWIAYDFGIGVTKEIVEIAWTASNYISETPTTLEVQYSDDGVTWVSVWGATTPGTWGNGETRVFNRPTSSAHYWVVDETAPTVDYLLAGAVGSKESLVLSDLPVTGTVLGVQVANLVAKTDAGLAKVKNLLRSGTTDGLGPEMSLSTSYLYNVSIHETDPATGAAWTKSAVDALEVGLQVTG